MTIEQTVDITADRRIIIEVPPKIPTGWTNVIIHFPVPPDTQLEESAAKDSPTPISDSLVGILSGIGDIDIDEIRMERLAKHLQDLSTPKNYHHNSAPLFPRKYC